MKSLRTKLMPVRARVATLKLMDALAVLLLAAVAGCGGGEESNMPPTFLEGTQSAASARALESVTFRITAQDAESASLRFSWESTAGTFGEPSDTGTTSEVTWTAPTCSPRGSSDATVTVVASDEQGGSASRSFTVSMSVERCRAVSIAGGLSHSLALRNDGTLWAWGNNTQSQLGEGTSGSNPTPGQVLLP